MPTYLKPDPHLLDDRPNPLMAIDAHQSIPLQPLIPIGHGKTPMTGWSSHDETLTWTIISPRAQAYRVSILLRSKTATPLILEITAAGQTLTHALPAATTPWDRFTLDTLLNLPAGQHILALRIKSATGSGDLAIDLHAVELTLPATLAKLAAEAQALRSKQTWFSDAAHGIFVHWTSQSVPSAGNPKPYADAVRDFDVERFADQAAQTGCSFVVFTTSHGEMYFPAPLKSLDAIIPGRTAKRDLVPELSAALARRNIKLFLYFHLGCEATWTAISGFYETDSEPYFKKWRSIIEEAGLRYGPSVAGWWFDDGAVTYLYHRPDWPSLTRAAKAGFHDRLVTYNAWELPSPTNCMDYHAGEFNEDPIFSGHLAPADHGLLPSGPYAGLLASSAFVAENDWVHTKLNTPIAPIRWTPEQLADLLGGFRAHHAVPIINLMIYQEGAFSESSLQTFAAACANLKQSAK